MMRSLLEDEAKSVFEIGPNAMGLDLLRAVYRNSSVELSTRLRCAMACLPFEVPKLAVTALVSESDFATVLDRRIARYQEMERTKLIEHTNGNATTGNATNGAHEPVEVKPTPSINYRAIKLRRRI